MTQAQLPGPDDLERLLHRCHSDELLVLARMHKVDSRRGLSQVAHQTARASRRSCSHGLGNILFRKGEGRSYPEILKDAAQILKVSPQADLEETELKILKHWFIMRWEQEKPETRQVLWARMGLSLPAPDQGERAAEVAESKLGRGFGYQIGSLVGGLRKTFGWIAMLIGLSPIGCLLRPFLMPFMAFWFLRPPPERIVETVVEVARLRQVVRRRVTVGVVGSPSSGKDAAIKALFGIDTGNVSPVAGSTKEVSIQRLLGSTALYVVNTPGMGDVIEAITEEAKQVLDHIDVYLYLINAEGGVQAREKADYNRCVATGKPVLAVVNKIDVLRPRDKDKYLADARQKLGAAPENFIAAAFDPLPALSPHPIHREEVHQWLSAQLIALGKDPSEIPPLPTLVSVETSAQEPP